MDYQAQLAEWKKELVHDRSFIKICNEKIQELFEAIKHESAYLDKNYSLFVARRGEEKSWYEWAIERSRERKKVLEKDMRKWQFLLRNAKGQTSGEGLEIDKAKSVPVDLLLGKAPGGTAARKFYKCPLHGDKTPSFCWYVVQNKVHCFSCGFHGDVIDLFMKLHNCDLKAAVKELSTY